MTEQDRKDLREFIRRILEDIANSNDAKPDGNPRLSSRDAAHLLRVLAEPRLPKEPDEDVIATMSLTTSEYRTVRVYHARLYASLTKSILLTKPAPPALRDGPGATMYRLRSYRSAPLMHGGTEEKFFPTLEAAEEAAARLREQSDYYCVEVRSMPPALREVEVWYVEYAGRPYRKEMSGRWEPLVTLRDTEADADNTAEGYLRDPSRYAEIRVTGPHKRRVPV